MFEVIIGSEKFTNKEISSISLYSDEDGQTEAWVSFNKDVSHFIGLNITITSIGDKSFFGMIEDIEQSGEDSFKLYCVGTSFSPNPINPKHNQTKVAG